MSKPTFEDLFAELEALAAERGITVYNIHFCKAVASVGIEWHEAARVTTQLPAKPKESALHIAGRLYSHACREAREKQIQEGLVTYEDYPNIRRAVKAELIEMRRFCHPRARYAERLEVWKAFRAKGAACDTSASPSD